MWTPQCALHYGAAADDAITATQALPPAVTLNPGRHLSQRGSVHVGAYCPAGSPVCAAPVPSQRSWPLSAPAPPKQPAMTTSQLFPAPLRAQRVDGA